MPPRSRLAALAVAAACLAIPARAAAATSSNWAGYISHKNGTRFRTVRGAWTVPAVSCTSPRSTYSAAWIGLGGYHTDAAALEQIGTESDCVHGRAIYEAWFELVPDQEATLPLIVRAGDALSARVSVSGRDATVRLSDLTRGTTYLRTLAASAIDTTSAEWIVEAPSQCAGSGISQCRILPLAPFADTTFTAARAVSALGHVGVIDDPAWAATSLDLAPGAPPFGRMRAATSGNATAGALSASGGSFVVSTA